MATSRDQLLQSAEKHVGKGKLDQALKDYLRVLDENPKDIATLNRVGFQLFRRLPVVFQVAAEAVLEVVRVVEGEGLALEHVDDPRRRIHG